MLNCHFNDLGTVNSQKVDIKFFQNADILNNVSLVKINLPRDWHNPIMLDLDLMNINSASLFPGLDGFARSLQLVQPKEISFPQIPRETSYCSS